MRNSNGVHLAITGGFFNEILVGKRFLFIGYEIFKKLQTLLKTLNTVKLEKIKEIE